jgi:hypothetical protein
MQHRIVFLSSVIIAALLAVALGSTLAAAESGKTGTDELRVEVEPESKKALRGESYIINVTVYAEKPANISISFNTSEEVLEVRPLENNIVNVTLGSGENRTFKFNITVKRTAYGNLTVDFSLKSNITQSEIRATHKIEVLVARNAILNLTKKLANQKVTIRVSCDKSKNYTLVTNETDKDGLIRILEIPALGRACNLTVILKTKLGAFLVNESVGIDLEKLPNSIIYPGYLVNASLNILTEEILKAKNVFINVTVNGNIDSFNLSRKKSFLFGLSERGENQRINVTVWIAANKHAHYLLNATQIEVRRGDRTVEVYMGGRAYSKSDDTLNVNIAVPVSKTMFNLYYFDEKGARRPLTSGVVRLVKVEVPLMYNASAKIFEKGVIKSVGESAVIVRKYNGTPVSINVTISFAGDTFTCGSVRLDNGATFKCNDLEARLFLDGKEAAIVVNLSRPLPGRVEFDNVIQRVLYWGTVRLYGVPKNASGVLKLGLSNIDFKCESRQAEGYYVCEGRVFLWPLALWPLQPERITGELYIDGETYRLEMGTMSVYAGVWGFALVVIMVIALVTVILVRRPAARPPREKLEIYDEHYDLG